MIAALGLTAAPAIYGAPFVCTGASSLKVTVTNQPLALQIGRGIGGLQWLDQPAYLIPGVHTIPGPLDAVRVQRAAPTPAGGKDPQYAIEAY